MNLIEGKSSDDPFVKQLEAAAEEIKADEKWREAYMQSIQRDRDKFDAGEDSGRGKEKIEIAEVMIRYGDSVDFITERTGLSNEEIEKLKEKLKKEVTNN